MYYSISTTPPGTSALAFQASASTSLLAPPFDNSNGLQSNAHYSGTLSSHRETQVGLGILFGGSDSLSRVDSFVIPIDDDPILEDQPLFLDSPRPPTLNALSPARLQCSPAPDDDFCVVDADLSTSTSAFSIRDWIIHPSSSPATSDALRGSPNAPHQCELEPDASLRPSDTLVNFNSPSASSAAPGTSVGVDPTIPAAPQARSSLTNICDSQGSMETVFLRVVEHICFSRVTHVSATTCLSPRQTLISRKDYASPRVSEPPSLQPPDVVFARSDIGRSPGRLFATPVEAPRELASNSSFNVGTTLMSPRNILSSNGFSMPMGLLASPDTPVFNMHEGVSECDLQRRANRYRRRYPGRSLDRHWLLKYAGKLNKDGKPVADYRCYISGCAQINKRRDHIIVHICSHVNERPFACRHCHMTFLRRNECKRHEAGHSGLKPFICRFCSPPAARFARQDLLTRHARRAHGMTPRQQREMCQQTPEMAAWSGENGPVPKRPRMAPLRPRTSREAYLE